MSYRKGDYFLTCQRTGEKIRRSEAVTDGDSGMIVKRGLADPKHPNEMPLKPRKPHSPTYVSPEPADHFLEANEITASDL
jgi:hypothetical protein